MNDLGDQQGSRQMFVCESKVLWTFYFCHLLIERPSAEEGNWVCDGSLTPSVAKGSWCFFVFRGTLKEPAFSDNLKASVLKENHLSLEHLQLMENKKHEPRPNRFSSCKL